MKGERINLRMSLKKFLIALLMLAVGIPYGCDARTSGAVSKPRTAGAQNAGAAACRNAKDDGAAYSQPLKWDVPQTKTDGTALNDIAGYRVYFGTASGMYTGCVDVQNVEDKKDQQEKREKQDNKSSLVCRENAADGKSRSGKKQCDYTVPMQSKGAYYFTVTAYDDKGNESDFSNEVSKLIK